MYQNVQKFTKEYDLNDKLYLITPFEKTLIDLTSYSVITCKPQKV